MTAAGPGNGPVAALTGGTGFLGRHVTQALLAAGWRVRLLARRDVQPAPGLVPVRGDLDDAAALDRLVAGTQAVVHLAGLTKAPDRARFLAVNRDGSARLAAAAAAGAPGARVILVSSLAARAPALSDYAGSKRAGEEAAVAALGGALPWVILRPGVIYGPGDAEGLALRRLAGGAVIPVPRGPEPRLGLVHARDVAAAILALCATGPAMAAFEVTDAVTEGHPWRDILGRVARLLGREPRFLPLPDAAFLAAGSAADGWARLTGRPSLFGRGKARELLHRDWGSSPARQLPAAVWAPRIGLAEGMAETLGWWHELGLVPRHG
jgi:nucleoside-diphosphate-sugar epimerase